MVLAGWICGLLKSLGSSTIVIPIVSGLSCVTDILTDIRGTCFRIHSLIDKYGCVMEQNENLCPTFMGWSAS